MKTSPKDAPRAPRATSAARRPRKAASEIPAQSKTALLTNMMGRPGGATSKDMESAAGWKDYSVRGLIGSLKKRGVTIRSLKEPGSPTRYVIAPRSDEAVI